MKSNLGRTISIKRTDHFIKAGFALFNWLFKLDQPIIIVLSNNNTELVSVQKQQHEIVKLEFDFSSLEEKFYKWRFSKKKTWDLNEEETDMFLQCCHAAQFYLTKQNYNIGNERQFINALYDSTFKQLL